MKILVKQMKKILILGVCALLLNACKPVENNDPAPDKPLVTAPVIVHLHTYWDDVEIDLYGAQVQSANTGRKANFNISQFYLTNFELVKADGSIYKVKDTLLLKKENASYIIGNVPVGNYKSIHFEVGIDSLSNLKTNPKGTALNDSIMWFDKNNITAGYSGFLFEGKIDTTADVSGEATVPFKYRLGASNTLAKVKMPDKAFTVVEKNSTYVHLLADYEEFFKGIDLSNVNNLTLINKNATSNDLGKKLILNIPKMFKYEQ